ncbi:MAG TPA: hypothetical protein PLQ19_00830 [Aeromicrobium sp.]|nr:hypothetical protein [Aeromicrobium sp.]
MIARLLATVTGISAGTAGVIVSLLMGLAAVLLFRKLILTVWPGSATAVPWVLFTAPLVLAAYPAAGFFNTAYSDATALAVVMLMLVLLTSKRYAWLCLVVLVLGLARPIAPPVGVVVIVHFWPQIVGAWRRDRVVPWRPIGWFTVIGFACVLSAALWPIIAAVVTGEPTALFETQASWPRPGNADPSIPFSVWIATRGGVVIGLATLAALLAIFAVLFRVNRLHPFGPEIYAWTLAYITFLLRPSARVLLRRGSSCPRSAFTFSLRCLCADGGSRLSC